MLRLFQGNVTDVSALGGCARLHTLDLSYCRQLLDVSALGGCAALRTLDLSQCSLLSDVSALAGCAALHTLDLWGCYRVTDVSVLATGGLHDAPHAQLEQRNRRIRIARRPIIEPKD